MRERLGQQPGPAEELDRDLPTLLPGDLPQLVEDALGADSCQHGTAGSGRLQQALRRPKVQASEEPRHPEQSQPVLSEALLRVPDRAQNALLEVAPAANRVHQLSREGVEVEGVEGEVAPRRVLLRRGHQAQLGRPSSIARAGLDAERGDLEVLAVAEDAHDPERSPHGDRPREECLHDLGRCGPCDIQVVELPPQEQVPHAAAHQVGLVAVALEPVDHPEGGLAADAVEQLGSLEHDGVAVVGVGAGARAACGGHGEIGRAAVGPTTLAVGSRRARTPGPLLACRRARRALPSAALEGSSSNWLERLIPNQ